MLDYFSNALSVFQGFVWGFIHIITLLFFLVILILKSVHYLAVVMHAIYPSTREVEAGRSV